MTVVQVERHIARDGFFAGVQHIQITIAHLRRDLETDVQQLPDAFIVERIRCVVAHGAGELFAGPCSDRGRPRQLREIDIDH